MVQSVRFAAVSRLYKIDHPGGHDLLGMPLAPSYRALNDDELKTYLEQHPPHKLNRIFTPNNEETIIVDGDDLLTLAKAIVEKSIDALNHMIGQGKRPDPTVLERTKNMLLTYEPLIESAKSRPHNLFSTSDAITEAALRAEYTALRELIEAKDADGSLVDELL